MQGLEEILAAYWDKIPFLVAFLGGVLAFLAPCTLPLIPVYLSYISGTMVINEKSELDKKSRLKIIFSTLFFVLGFSLVFISMSILAYYFGNFIKKYIYNIWTFRVLGIIVILMGLHVIGILKINLMNREKRVNVEVKEVNYLKAMFLGMAFAFGWSPCVGPILGTILIFSANADTLLRGIMYLLLFSAGLGLPFILFGIFIKYLFKFIKNIKRHMRKIELLSGIILILMGVILFFNRLDIISSIF